MDRINYQKIDQLLTQKRYSRGDLAYTSGLKKPTVDSAFARKSASKETEDSLLQGLEKLGITLDTSPPEGTCPSSEPLIDGNSFLRDIHDILQMLEIHITDPIARYRIYYLALMKNFILENQSLSPTQLEHFIPIYEQTFDRFLAEFADRYLFDELTELCRQVCEAQQRIIARKYALFLSTTDPSKCNDWLGLAIQEFEKIP